MMSTLLTRHYFLLARNAKSGFESTYFQAFPGNAKNNVGSAGRTLFLQFPGNAAKNLQKKVPEWGPEKVLESAGLVEVSRPSLARPDFQVGPKTSKMSRNGSKIHGLG